MADTPPSATDSTPPDRAAPVRRWRAFGEAGDLDVALDALDRPSAVSSVLARCRLDGGEDVWAMTLAERIGGLLEIVRRNAGRDELELTLRCAAPACGEQLAAAVSIPALLEMAEEAARRPALDLPDLGITLRRPRGADQRIWLRAGAAGRGALQRRICADLATPTLVAAQEAALARISEALDAFDPLVAFSVSLACPVCGAATEAPVDLEALALNALQRVQEVRVREVHRIARAYGWGKAAILALPSTRRARYLRLITGEEGRA